MLENSLNLVPLKLKLYTTQTPFAHSPKTFSENTPLLSAQQKSLFQPTALARTLSNNGSFANARSRHAFTQRPVPRVTDCSGHGIVAITCSSPYAR